MNSGLRLIRVRLIDYMEKINEQLSEVKRLKRILNHKLNLVEQYRYVIHEMYRRHPEYMQMDLDINNDGLVDFSILQQHHWALQACEKKIFELEKQLGMYR